MPMVIEFIEIVLGGGVLVLFAGTFCYSFVVLSKYGKPGKMWGMWHALDTLEGRYAIRRLFRLFFATFALGVLLGIVDAINPITQYE